MTETRGGKRSYVENVFILASTALCRRQILVKAVPISLVAPEQKKQIISIRQSLHKIAAWQEGERKRKGEGKRAQLTVYNSFVSYVRNSEA